MNHQEKCYNHYCDKVLTEEDKSDFGYGIAKIFCECHLCKECWRKFDGQKMRGRFRRIGVNHEQMVEIVAKIDQLAAEDGRSCPFVVGRPEEEERYTESMTEWIEWQKEKTQNG